MSILLSSPSLTEGGTVPTKFTCDGENISPALAWTGVPAGTQEIVLIVDDPDAPSGLFVHWVIYNIPPTLSGLPQGIPPTPDVAGIGVQGINGSRRTGYMGPCPPKGLTHRYFFKVYALKMELNLGPGATSADVERAMKGLILAQGQMIVKYSR